MRSAGSAVRGTTPSSRIVGADPAHRGERGFAAVPQRRPLGLVGAILISKAPWARQIVCTWREQLELGAAATQGSNQQNRPRAHRRPACTAS